MKRLTPWLASFPSVLRWAVLVTLLISPTLADAQTFTWDGGGVDGDWSTAANWNPDGSPADGGTWEIYEFDGVLQLNSNNDLTAGSTGWNVNDFEFLAGAGAFTLTDNGQGFDMLGAPNAGAPDGDADIINNSANTQTISARLIHRPDFNTGLVFNTATADIDVTSVISQAGGGSDTVRKTGSETLTLTGTNTYTNDTVVSAGVLELSGTGSLDSDVIVNSGGTLRLSSSTNSIDVGADITLNGTGILDLRENENINGLSGNGIVTNNSGSTFFLGIGESNASTTFSGTIQDGTGTVDIDKLGAGTLTLTGNNSYDGFTEVMAGSLNIQSDTALGGTTGGTQVNDGATLQLQGGITVTGEALSITGSGIGGALRNISGNNTWTGDVTATGTPFARIVSDAGELTVSGDVTVTAGTLVLQGAGNGEVSGDIVSAVPLIKSVTGAGTWILSGTNSHTTTTISNGTLQIGDGGATGTLGSGAVTNNGALVFDRSNALAVSNAISGSGSVEQAGPGTTTLSNNANSYAGTTTISDGVLRITAAGALGSTAGGTVVIGDGPRLELSGGITVSGESITISGRGGNDFGALQNFSGTNTWDGPVVIGSSNARVGANAGTLTIDGIIDDGGSTFPLNVRNNTGTTVVTAANTYDGATNVIVGTLQLDGGDDRLPTGTTLVIGNGSNVSSATFDLNARDQTVAGLDSAGTSMPMTVTNTGGADSTLTVNNSANFTYDGTITNGANALNLVKDNTGTLTLTAANSYTGLTTVDQGVLNIRDDMALGTTGGVTDLATGFTNATIQLQGGITVAEPLNVGNGGVTGTLQNVSGNNEWSGAITKSGVLTLLTDSGNFLVSGDIGGTANSVNLRGVSTGEVSGDITSAFQVNKFDSGTWTLSGNNSYTSLTNVTAGVLRVTSDTALGTTATGTTVANNAALQLTNNITVTGESLTIAGHGIGSTGSLRNLSGNNTWTGAITMQSGVQSRIHSDAGLLTLTGGISSPGVNSLFLSGAGDGEETGTISGVNQLVKQGSGTWTLSGNNTYTTPTVIQAGTLVVENGDAIPDGSTVTVNGTADLNIGDSETIGALTLNNTASVTGGSELTMNGTITANGTNTIGGDTGTLDLNSNSVNVPDATDSLTVTRNIIDMSTGTLTKDGSGTLNINGGATLDTITNNAAAPSGTININSSVSLSGLTGITNDANLVINSGVVDLNGNDIDSDAAGSSFTLAGGTLEDVAEFTGNLLQTGGTLRAGELDDGDLLPPDMMSIVGNLTQTGGVIEVKVEGPQDSGDFDVYTVDGNVILAGTLKIISDFNPGTTASTGFFTDVILATGSIMAGGLSLDTGMAPLTGPPFRNWDFIVVNRPGGGQALRLIVTPEPGSVLIWLLVAGIGLVFVRRQRLGGRG